jgi:hypothetical protein
MVERRKPKLNGQKKPSGFQKGNTLAIGNPGGNTPERRITRRIISREWFNELTRMDPQTQMTTARRLIRKAIKDGLQDGVRALAVLKEGTDRIEGNAVQPLIIASMNEQTPTINRNMSPAEAEAVFRSMLRRPGEQIDIDELEEDTVSQSTDYSRLTQSNKLSGNPEKGEKGEKQPLDERLRNATKTEELDDDRDEAAVRKTLHTSPYERALNHPKMRERRR